ncbi:TonB family protein [Sphingomonas lutea]|uniref:TonB family protein n=1 Tax=Sphingomonas lutea TaxID=1045317 RepID=A0A7G9SJG1_9SPHN|nr:TonB family protein [Sphingomonas lutea]QNN67986.1 TonB family protein [Sphingomonas lutea]
MSSYRGTADPRSRAKAMVAVAAIHAALAAAILTGLNVRFAERAVEKLQMIDVRLPPPPEPPPPPPPASEAKRVELEEGAAGKRAEPTPVVAPTPRIPVETPIAAAPIAGTGSAPTAGAANAGTGMGAGGSGSGRGGGGVDYSKFTPAQRISRIPNREYRRLVAVSGQSRGRVGITLKVNPDGSPSNCRIAQSSGNGVTDSLMCQLALQHVRFRPARDDRGRAIAQDITWYPDWAPN